MKTKHYINIQESLYSNSEIKLADKLVLGYILSIYSNTNNFYMSDKTLSENLGSTIRQIRTSIEKLNKFDWFTITTTPNYNNNEYGGKTRNINIDLAKLNDWLNGDTPEVKESTSEELRTSNNVKLEEVRIPTEDELDNQIDNELDAYDKLVTTTIKKINPNYSYDDWDAPDLEKLVNKLIKLGKHNDRRLLSNLNEEYLETENVIKLVDMIN